MPSSFMAKQVEQEIRQLCYNGLDSVTLRRTVMQRLRQLVPFDGCCWGTIDPDTLLITSEVSQGIPDFAFAPVAENEYLIDDVNKFSQLARNHNPVGILSDSTHGAPNHSPRFRAVLTRAGFAHELRAAFVADHACWGGVTLLRNPDSPDFTLAESRVLAQLSATLAEGFRLALLGEQSAVTVDSSGPGLLVFDKERQVQLMNQAAEAWLTELLEPNHRLDLARLPAPIYEVAMRAQAIARANSDSTSAMPLQAHLRVRTRAGRWLMLHGSHLIHPDAAPASAPGETAIILEAAQSSQIAQLLMLAYDLTSREREVLQLVIKGAVAKEMAVSLQVSTHTVQDHLKALFRKVGVHSRGELVARVLGEHYFPHLGGR